MRLALFPMVVVCLLSVMKISGQVVNENLTEVIVTNSGSTVKLVVDHSQGRLRRTERKC